jgi:sugar phosphate isomerase/epimerase
MFIEVITGLPRDGSDTFEKTVQGAKEAGALAIRVACLSGRRYETFSTHAEWKDFADKSRDGVIRAASIAEKHKMPVAIENHKDWTSDELVKILKQISSEYVGACLDTGNNIALLEDPMAVVEALAPYALSTHMKDMGLAEMAEGFELSEVPFGEGTLDLRKVVKTISAARPKTRYTLEMMTRNPLKVPCLTTKYWATFPDRSGYSLVVTLQNARSNKKPLPRVDGLDPTARQKLEEENVRKCLDYSRRELGV